MTTVHGYNQIIVTKRPELPVVKEARWCLVSGGVYKHQDATMLDVATATIRGMMLAKCDGMNVTMMYGDDVFRLAYDNIRKTFLPSESDNSRGGPSFASAATAVIEHKEFASKPIAIRPPVVFELPSNDNVGLPMFPRTRGETAAEIGPVTCLCPLGVKGV